MAAETVHTETVRSEPFHWDQQFVSGLGVVDAQHHGLVAMIHRLGRLLVGLGAATDALTGLPNRRHALRLLSGHGKEAVAKDAPWWP
ncbi:MAG: hypothetical protein ACKO5F_06840 [Synechococcus sp.]